MSNQCKHTDREYEFPPGRFYLRGKEWRGDSRCNSCHEAWFTKEAIRMEVFGLMGNPNPPGSKAPDRGTADSAMFQVVGVEVKV